MEPLASLHVAQLLNELLQYDSKNYEDKLESDEDEFEDEDDSEDGYEDEDHDMEEEVDMMDIEDSLDSDSDTYPSY